MKKIVIILNNIRSSENVGSIFRTSDAVCVEKIFLVGYTPAPLDRFNRVNNRLVKSALGAEKTVGWERAESLKRLSIKLKQEGFTIIGIEQNENSIDYTKISELFRRDPNNADLALIFGNELEGLSQEDLELCDVVAEIKMKGNKESLNVAVSVGIVLYSLINHN